MEKFAVSFCGEIRALVIRAPAICTCPFVTVSWTVDEHDDELVSLTLRDKVPTADRTHHREAVEVFCEGTMGLCLESERELLGDWDGDGKVPDQFPTVDLPKDYL